MTETTLEEHSKQQLKTKQVANKLGLEVRLEKLNLIEESLQRQSTETDLSMNQM